jgi:hypothetical protein
LNCTIPRASRPARTWLQVIDPVARVRLGPADAIGWSVRERRDVAGKGRFDRRTPPETSSGTTPGSPTPPVTVDDTTDGDGDSAPDIHPGESTVGAN